MEYYAIPLRLAKVFLKHQSFSSLRGKDNVFALLFPMEKVFENYIEFVLNKSKENLNIEKVLVNGGKDEYLLNTGDNCGMTRLQPDYLLQMKLDYLRKINNTSPYIVTDAKWKLLDINENEKNDCNKVNISSGDVYQIFSYLHYYAAQDIAYIFVPHTDNIEKMTLTYNRTDEKKKIKIIPIDLEETINKNHILEEGIF
jgi:5-methylcytosine-specific restriction enzyme subunit McrC